MTEIHRNPLLSSAPTWEAASPGDTAAASLKDCKHSRFHLLRSDAENESTEEAMKHATACLQVLHIREERNTDWRRVWQLVS